MKICPICNGTQECAKCNGKGRLNKRVDPLWDLIPDYGTVVCKFCYQYPGSRKCSACRGTGMVPEGGMVSY